MRAPTRSRTGAPWTFGVGDAGFPVLGLTGVTAAGDPLRGRHLHRTQPITVQWITSFSGLHCHGGTQPSRSLQPPEPRGPRADPAARVNMTEKYWVARRGVNKNFGQARAPEHCL